jgi:hypothetical protein
MVKELKIWFHLPVRVVEAAIAAMRSMVGRRHRDASREDNEQRSKDMRDDADQLAEDAEELRRDLKQGLSEDRHPPPARSKPDDEH